MKLLNHALTQYVIVAGPSPDGGQGCGGRVMAEERQESYVLA